MGPKIVVLRTLIRGALAMTAMLALAVMLKLLLTELNTDSPNPALTALLGGITTGVASFLVVLGNAIGQNPSDRGSD